MALPDKDMRDLSKVKLEYEYHRTLREIKKEIKARTIKSTPR